MEFRNKCSVLHLKDCSEVTKLDSEVSLSRENIHFPSSGLSSQDLIVVQSRPEAEAGQLSDLGWTVQISENENSIATKKLRYRALSPLSSPSNAAQNIYSAFLIEHALRFLIKFNKRFILKELYHFFRDSL